MAIPFLETENVCLSRVYSIQLVIFFYYILRALLSGYYVAFNNEKVLRGATERNTR